MVGEEADWLWTVTVKCPPATGTAVVTGRAVCRSAFHPADDDGVPSSSSDVSGMADARRSSTPGWRANRLVPEAPSQVSCAVGVRYSSQYAAPSESTRRTARVPVRPENGESVTVPPAPDVRNVCCCAAGRSPSRSAWAALSEPTCSQEMPMTS